MSDKHTPEPWDVRPAAVPISIPEGALCVLNPETGEDVCYLPPSAEQGADAARIVSLNALAGIRNPAAVGEAIEALREIADGQWDELGGDEEGRSYLEIPSDRFDAARAALAALDQEPKP